MVWKERGNKYLFVESNNDILRWKIEFGKIPAWISFCERYMNVLLTAWFVYGTFNLDSPIYTELYETNHCESAYEEIIKEKDLEVKSSDYNKNYVGYGCYGAGDS